MEAQAPSTSEELREAALAARKSGKRAMNAQRQHAKDLARFEAALETAGIELIEVSVDNPQPDRAKE